MTFPDVNLLPCHSWKHCAHRVRQFTSDRMGMSVVFEHLRTIAKETSAQKQVGQIHVSNDANEIQDFAEEELK